MKFILGTKVGMTQVFDESGRVFPATVISAGPNSVTQVKTEETDGYNAVQVAFKDQKEHRMNKPLMGHFNKAGVTPKSELREFRTEGAPEQKVGDVIDASTFEVGDNITVRGISKGKGFQGVVKRYGFHGGPRTHGQKHTERSPGSIGGGAGDGGRVARGKKMPGRMGSDMTTVKNLKVVAVIAEDNTIMISGAVPGRQGTIIEVISK
ncbi:50S ribosomal protein L3 [Candidatus Wolfebacteria bacterium]|nr:50S ribosomal protein L3 [Candidatus Wolfebacteria bacterium]